MLNFVWVPGWSYTADIFQHTIDRLDSTFGPQNHIPIDFSDCTDAESLPKALTEKLRLTEGKTVVTGWSLGAMVTQKVLESRPDMAELIFLVSTSPAFIQSDAYPDGISAKELAALKKLLSRNPRKTVTSFRCSLYTEPERQEYLFKKGHESEIPPIKSLLAGLDFLARYAIDDTASAAVSSPLYLLHGELDGLCNPNAVSTLCNIYQNARLERAKNLGHDILFVAPHLLSDKIISVVSERDFIS